MYRNVAFNHLNAKDSNMAANTYANAAKQRYINDSLLTLAYHRLNNGKWNHMMS
ncbi:MAG TPA: hypothetical protein VER36_03275 [Flavisolibacter sp.]|nr:hypothetical protein [Flavisolibacter sp.]